MSKKQKRTDYPLNSTRRKAPAPAAAHAAESHGDHHETGAHHDGHHGHQDHHDGHHGDTHHKDEHSSN